MSGTSKYIGHTALVGITYLNADGSAREQIQVYGTVTRVDEGGWFVLNRSDGKGEFKFAPKLMPAKPGSYRLRSTGEVIVNPEFIGTFTVRPPPGK